MPCECPTKGIGAYWLIAEDSVVYVLAQVNEKAAADAETPCREKKGRGKKGR